MKIDQDNNYNRKLLPLNINYIFEGRFTILKPISDNEITNNYVSWLNNKELNQYLEGINSNQSKETITEYINDLRRGGICDLFAIFRKKDNNHIGNLAIRSLNEKNNGILEFGLIIGDKNARAMGLGAEVYILLLEYAFSSPKITRINATTAADNVIACRTLKSIGFVKESVKKMGFLLNNNEKCDAINYRILSSEWSQKREKVKHLIMHMKITNLNK